MMPVTEVFEAELDVLELLDYRSIIAKGYTCIMHIHTYNDEIEIKDLLKTIDVNEKGEKVEKLKPMFAKSQSKLTCRIAPRTPIALEKFDVMPQMARFTLRDEGRTIAIGKVTKYKPYAKGVVGTNVGKKEEQKKSDVAKGLGAMAIVDKSDGKNMTFNMETGEMSEKKEEKVLEGIQEGDEDEEEK